MEKETEADDGRKLRRVEQGDEGTGSTEEKVKVGYGHRLDGGGERSRWATATGLMANKEATAKRG